MKFIISLGVISYDVRGKFSNITADCVKEKNSALSSHSFAVLPQRKPSSRKFSVSADCWISIDLNRSVMLPDSLNIISVSFI